jgi:hypothetical protein
MKTRGRCYACGEPATSDDHVPPKVFFPERKDVGTNFGDLRRNLVKVPSCALHNEAASSDDEYAAYVICMHEDSNSVANAQFMTKVIRALERSPRLRETVLQNLRPVEVDGRNTGMFTVDMSRFDGTMRKIVRGLYFVDHLRPLPGSAEIIVPTPRLRRASTLDRSPDLVDLERRFFGHIWTQGLVGDMRVFRYEWWDDPGGSRLSAYRMTFYGGFTVLAVARVLAIDEEEHAARIQRAASRP